MNVRFKSKAYTHRFYFRKIFLRQNRKGFFTNSVEVGLQSTSATWDRVSPIPGVPGLLPESQSIGMVVED